MRAVPSHPCISAAFFALTLSLVCPALHAQQSIARVWNEEILKAIRVDLPHPPAHARNLFHLSVAMYDAWAAYDSVAVGYLYHQKHTASDIQDARRTAISYAAYRLLRERYALSRNAAITLPILDQRMHILGFDINNVSQDPATPIGLGNLIASTVSSYAIQDGALQLRSYADLPPEQGGYASINRPLVTGSRESFVFDVNRWQPLVITNAVSQNGIPVDAIQKFVGAQWKWVRPFALTRNNSNLPWIDPGPPPQLGGLGDKQFRDEVVDVIRMSGELDPDDGVLVDISPGKFGNSTLGQNDGTGHPVNPVTGQPYAPNPVKRGDFTRILAEYWADGPNSETPPGHWNVIANYVSDQPGFQKRIGGTGPLLDDLEWDVKFYLALNAATHDAACAAWSLKRHYDGWRPIAAIRYMAMLGQSTDPNSFLYHPRGLPLIPGLIEEVTFESSNPGQRHFGLSVGEVAIKAWPGQPPSPTTQHSGARWMLAVDWLPFQKANFVTPAFPGFVSGHSTFSRAAAEVMTRFTGSAFFPGGLGKKSFPSNAYLTFEQGPSEALELQWATYYDAADQAGLSRLWGGIHVSVDDVTGRRIGSQVGIQAWNLVNRYFDGSILNTPVALTMIPANAFECELRFNTVRGMFYKLQYARGLELPFDNDATGWFRATESEYVQLDSVIGLQRFFRVLMASSPE